MSMQCERAEEFFSDYLERTLEAPLAAAVDAHIQECARCREDVAGLRAMFATLDETTAVEPPPQGDWQVIWRLREQWAARERENLARQVQPGLLAWLQSLRPVSVAMGAGLATMIIGGTLFVSGVSHTRLGFTLPRGSTAQVDRHAAAAELPSVDLTYGDASEAGQQLTLALKPPHMIPDAHVLVAGDYSDMTWEGRGAISPDRPAELGIRVRPDAAAEVLRVTITSEALSREYRQLVVVPLVAYPQDPQTLVLVHQPLGEALRRIAPALARPVVVDLVTDGTVSLQVEEVSPLAVLDSIARQIDARVQFDGGVYRLVPEQR
jgi:anti-sigma factor RsiW